MSEDSKQHQQVALNVWLDFLRRATASDGAAFDDLQSGGVHFGCRVMKAQVPESCRTRADAPAESRWDRVAYARAVRPPDRNRRNAAEIASTFLRRRRPQ